MRQPVFLYTAILFLAIACSSPKLTTHDYPNPVDTSTRPIEFQEKKTYEVDGVFADNQFDGARLNDFKHDGGNAFSAVILPENVPINPSPYYGFKLWSAGEREIELKLDYPGGYYRHRYYPKVSRDGENWTLLDSTAIRLDTDSVDVFLTLKLGTEPLWLAAQEIQNSGHVKAWCMEQAAHPSARFSSIGKSALDRDMFFLDIYEDAPENKDIIVVISRQHPPEVTGYLAMKSFVEELLVDSPISNAFRKKYHVLVYPLMNPDGVDLGHWRHNAGGIDQNRDWAYYRQPENRQVATHIVETSGAMKSTIILGLDFHSTYFDVFYTNEEVAPNLPNFNDYWIWGMEKSLGVATLERPSNPGGPVSKNWFFTQFGAEGVVYELGDSTPRDYIDAKGRNSAVEMMQLLLLR